MTARDRSFTLLALGATVVVPGLLLLLRPFDEARAELGLLAGWGAALLIMVPSYVLLSRVIGSTDRTRFLGGFLGGSLGRLVLTVVAVLAFLRLVPDAPRWSFVVSYFAGYFVLTVAELLVTVGRAGGRREPDGSAA